MTAEPGSPEPHRHEAAHRHDPDGHEAHRHEAAHRHDPDGHEAHRHEAAHRHEPDGHEAHRHEAQGSEPPRHEARGHEAHRLAATAFRPAAAVRHDAMRARNLALVLGEVAARGSLTRAALAEITGLTKTTVSKLVGDLLEAGLVVETGAVRDGERGRPGVEVQISGARIAAIGLEINVDYLAARVVDLSRVVRHRRTQAVDNRSPQPVDVIAQLRRLALEAVDDAVREGLRVIGGVLAVPGPVDIATGTVHNAPNLGWRDVPVGSLLDLPFPVHVDNEANLAALGELWFGSGVQDFLYVSGEIGIGAGLVVGGTLFRGAYGFAGELGHVVVSPDGPACRCGSHGCLEVYAGQEALTTALVSANALATPRHAGDAGGTAALGSAAAAGSALGARQRASDAPGGDELGGRQRASDASGVDGLVMRLQAGDAEALGACERAGWALGVALSSAVNLVDPGAIILGGILGPLFPWLSGTVSAALTERLGRIRTSVPSLLPSAVGPDAAVLGAAGQVLRHLLADPSTLVG